MNKRIYLDYQASTPVDERVLTAMLPWLQSKMGNPHSVHHAYGRDAADAIAESRLQIAKGIEVLPEDIIFTSGATEANNLAIFGLARADWPTRPRLIAPKTEHKSVLEPLVGLAQAGFDLDLLPVGSEGLIDLADLKRALVRGRSVVSIMIANSEIGVLQPLKEIGELCHHHGAILHCDASQAFGKIPIAFDKWAIDIMTFSGHKIYGPMGIGALVANSTVRRRLTPIIVGGGQQETLRAGTIPTFLCVGLAEAVKLSIDSLSAEPPRLLALRDRLLQILRESEEVVLNGSSTERIPGNLNIRFPGIDALSLIALADGIAISTGSACASTGGARVNSHVLHALGLDDESIRSSIRLGIGRFTTDEEIDSAGTLLLEAVRIARQVGKR